MVVFVASRRVEWDARGSIPASVRGHRASTTTPTALEGRSQPPGGGGDVVEARYSGGTWYGR